MNAALGRIFQTHAPANKQSFAQRFTAGAGGREGRESNNVTSLNEDVRIVCSHLMGVLQRNSVHWAPIIAKVIIKDFVCVFIYLYLELFMLLLFYFILFFLFLLFYFNFFYFFYLHFIQWTIDVLQAAESIIPRSMSANIDSILL